LLLIREISPVRTIAKLFGRSPFGPLQAHMGKVAECVQAATNTFEAMKTGQWDQVEQGAAAVSKLEHEADLLKNDIRNHIPRSLFMPVDRSDLLEILGVQDSIADRAEDMAILLTFRPKWPLPQEIAATFEAFHQRNLEAFEAVRLILGELDELLESSFGGNEAEKVKLMVDDVALKEHEVDVLQRELLKGVLAHEDAFTKGEFHLWMKLIEGFAALSNLSEKLAYRIRMTLERK
jgi:predicted phosphate transport protein (TIGR00153 family)